MAKSIVSRTAGCKLKYFRVGLIRIGYAYLWIRFFKQVRIQSRVTRNAMNKRFPTILFIGALALVAVFYNYQDIVFKRPQ